MERSRRRDSTEVPEEIWDLNAFQSALDEINLIEGTDISSEVQVNGIENTWNIDYYWFAADRLPLHLSYCILRQPLLNSAPQC